MTPSQLASQLQSLPPILHMIKPNPMPSYSKAPLGLSVLSRVNGIFTANAISPGPSLRQYPDRSAIRAGRNLPDKEFRYLSTVIVTAAVHWGFNSRLAPLLLTFQHRAGVSPYTSSCDLAETCVFDKQSPGFFRCGLVLLRGRAYPEVTPVVLPSSLTRVLPSALVYSTHLPELVCGTDAVIY